MRRNRDRSAIKKIICKICGNEALLYIFWGITTTAFSIISYTLLKYIMDYKIANLISIIATKVYAYLVNKKFVFKSSCFGRKELIYELTAYVLSRGFTGVLDFFGVIVLAEIFYVDQNLAKYTLVLIAMALNYILGKKVVFIKKEKSKNGI